MLLSGQYKKRDVVPHSFSEIHEMITEHRDTGNGFYLTGRKYPSGDVEVTALKLSAEDSLKRGGGATRKNRTRAEMSPEVRAKSISRAKRAIRQKALTIEADHLWTYTFRDNVTDLKVAFKVFSRYIKYIQRHYNGEFKYVCVPELQERGAVHFHMAVHGFYHVALFRRLWCKAIRSVLGERSDGKTDGNVDAVFIKNKHDRVIKKPKRIAGYISKYISKDCECTQFDGKRYSTGGKIVLPEKITGWVACGLCMEDVLNKIITSLTYEEPDCYIEHEGYFTMMYATT